MRLSQVAERVIDAIADRLDNPSQVYVIRAMTSAFIRQYGDLDLLIEVRRVQEVQDEKKG